MSPSSSSLSYVLCFMPLVLSGLTPPPFTLPPHLPGAMSPSSSSLSYVPCFMPLVLSGLTPPPSHFPHTYRVR